MSKSDPPQPPDPRTTAAAQTGANVSTSIANAWLNNTNQTTPLGSLSYDQTGSFQFTDPSNGQVYNIPRFTATQTLSPSQAYIQNSTEHTRANLADLANEQGVRIRGLLGSGFDPTQTAGPIGDPNEISGIPRAQDTFYDTGGPLRDLPFSGSQQTGFGDAGQQAGTFGAVDPLATSYGGAGNYQLNAGPYAQQQMGFGATPGSVFGFGGAGDVTRNYGPADDFSSDRQRVEQSLFSRLSPQLERERTNLEQRLADQGIRYGSTAYNDAMKDYNDRAAAQQVAVTQAGGAEQQRMMDMAAQRAGFENAAQQQEYQQQRGRGEFYNAAEQQAFMEAQARGQFGNTAATQQLQNQLAAGGFANQAQAAQAAEALQRGTFANAAQQAAFGQAQARGTFANQAQQALYEQLLGRGQFSNAAQAQQAQEELNRGQFINQAQAQENAQAMSRVGFRNTALQQQVAQAQAAFNASNASRAQYLQEQYAQRNQPINEISALLSQSQVQQPQFMQTPQQQIPTTDYASLINQNFAQQFQNYQTQQQAQNQLLGGVLGAAGSIGAGFAFRSDRRVKEDITRMGSVFAENVGGKRKTLPIYKFAFKDDPASVKHVGPMAQDVAKIDPRAVTTIGGVKHIYPERVMGAILKAA